MPPKNEAPPRAASLDSVLNKGLLIAILMLFGRGQMVEGDLRATLERELVGQMPSQAAMSAGGSHRTLREEIALLRKDIAELQALSYGLSDAVEIKFSQIDRRADKADRRLDKVEARLAQVRR